MSAALVMHQLLCGVKRRTLAFLPVQRQEEASRQPRRGGELSCPARVVGPTPMAEGRERTCCLARVCPQRAPGSSLQGGHGLQPRGPAQGLSLVGLPQCIFLPQLVLPGEGAFPALSWSDSVVQCWWCAVPAVCLGRASAQLHRGCGLLLLMALQAGGRGGGIWGGLSAGL